MGIVFKTKNRVTGAAVSGWVYCLLVAGAMVIYSPSGYSQQQEEEEKDTYIGVDFGVASIDALDQTYSPVTMRGRLGLVVLPDLVPTLSVEAHVGFDVTDDTNTVNGTDVTLQLNNFAALYARASQPVADIITVYGLLGFSATQLQGGQGFLEDRTQTGLSFGAGALFSLPYDIDGFVEAMQLVKGDVFEIYAFSIGISYKL
ncbi:MAG: outer membrane beta-barrel protein [Gammaproteobacteria bacterium]